MKLDAKARYPLLRIFGTRFMHKTYYVETSPSREKIPWNRFVDMECETSPLSSSACMGEKMKTSYLSHPPRFVVPRFAARNFWFQFFSLWLTAPGPQDMVWTCTFVGRAFLRHRSCPMEFSAAFCLGIQQLAVVLRAADIGTSSV